VCSASRDCQSGLCENDRCECARDTCADDYPGQCASDFDDGCGGTLDCSGVCSGDDVCYQNACCTPRPASACGACRGVLDDGCGGDLDCGGGGTVCFNYTASNFDATAYDASATGAVTLNCGISTFDGISRWTRTPRCACPDPSR
jgi:hypothetical protein